MRKKLHTREWREDHVLQRHADLWNQVAKSELIVDIISGKSLTQIIVSEEIRDGIYYRWLLMASRDVRILMTIAMVGLPSVKRYKDQFWNIR